MNAVALVTRGMVAPLQSTSGVGISEVLRIEEEMPKWNVRIKNVIEEGKKGSHAVYIKSVYEKDSS